MKNDSKLNELARKVRSLNQKDLGLVFFSPIEQELMNRVFRSVVTGMSSKEDRVAAQEIITKTNWIKEETY